jgi:hypothetical protein
VVFILVLFFFPSTSLPRPVCSLCISITLHTK